MSFWGEQFYRQSQKLKSCQIWVREGGGSWAMPKRIQIPFLVMRVCKEGQGKITNKLGDVKDHFLLKNDK